MRNLAQQNWIQLVEEANEYSGKPILITNHYKAPDETWPMGIWIPLSQADFPIDYRTILQNELVFDIDFRDWENLKEFGSRIVVYLQEQRIPFIISDTGGKGIHIHIFYKMQINEEIQELLKKAYKNGFSEKAIRSYLWHEILSNAKIDKNYIGKGKPFDTTVVNFSDESKGHVIREFGGRKTVEKDELGNMKFAYKTLIPEIPKRKSRCFLESEVVYPTKIDYWNVPVGKLKMIVDKFISATVEEEKPKIIEKIEGAYTTLFCVQKLINGGIEEGNRHDGAGMVALCCALDKLNDSQTMVILKQYHKACNDLGGLTQFSVQELKHWVDWYNHQPYIYFDMRSVNILTQLGVHNADCPCKLNEKMYANAMEFLKTNNLFDEIQKEMSKLIVNEKENRFILFLCYLSCYLKERIHPQLAGTSSIGKTYLMGQVLEFIPEEDILTKATGLSPKALNYFLAQDPKIPRVEVNGVSIPNIDGKIIVVQEFEGAQEAIITLRPLMSGDQDGIEAHIVEKDSQGKNVSKTLRAKGTPLFCCASTSLQLDEEFMTRTWKIECNDTAEQTKAIMIFQADEDIHPGIHVSERKELVKESIRLLKTRYKLVINPYSPLLAKKIHVTDEYVRLRRDFKKIKEFIKISAWLHQFQRPKIEIDGKVYIVASLEDYNLIKQLVEKSFILIFEGSEDLRKLYKKIQEIQLQGEDATVPKLALVTGWGTDKTYKRLKLLDAKGMVIREKGYDPDDKRKIRWNLRERERPVFPVLTQDDLKEFHNELRTKDPQAADILAKIIE